jgi:predicted lactoylglutathione lyase
MLAVCIPYNEEAHDHGNGNMIAIPGGSREGVDKLYAKAIELGATDEGPPGERLPIFYGGYVRDLDGNKLCFFEMKMG